MCLDCLISKTKYAAEQFYYTGQQWITREWERDLHPAVCRAILEYAESLSNGKSHHSTAYQQVLYEISQVIAPEWPHASITDSSQVAYTRSPEHGAADRQTFCKLGGYIVKHLPQLSGARIETIVTEYKESAAMNFRIVTDDDLVDAMFHTNAHSCMHPCRHNGQSWDHDNFPYRVYSSRLGWGMVIRENADDQGLARSIIRLEEKQFVRIYGSYPEAQCSTRGDDPALREWLRVNGYSTVSTFEGYKIERILDKLHPDYHIGPYIDGDYKTCKFIKDDPSAFLIHRDGNWGMSRTDGRMNKMFEDREGMVKCHSGVWVLPENAIICLDGRLEPLSHCVFIERHNGYIHAERAILVDGRYEWTQDIISVYTSKTATSHVMNTTPTVSVSLNGATFPALESACIRLYSGLWAFKEDTIELTSGKYKGMFALATDTVTRKKDRAIILRAHSGHTVFTVSDKQWNPGVGDRVKLADFSFSVRHYGHGLANPIDCIGTISRLCSYGVLEIKVKWDNGCTNTYLGRECFELVQTKEQYLYEKAHPKKVKAPAPAPAPVSTFELTETDFEHLQTIIGGSHVTQG